MKKPVVVHGIRGYLAGTETFVGNQVTTLQSHTPIVVCHHRSPNREFDIKDMYVIRERDRGVWHALGTFTYLFLRSLTPGDVTNAADWLSEFQPSLFHFHFGVDAAFFLPLYKKLKIPAVVSLYGYDISSFPNVKGGYGRVYLKRAFDTMDCFLVMSEDMKRDAIALGVPEKRIAVHYHGINAQRFCVQERVYEKNEQFNILCVGSLERKKGQHHLLRAVAALQKERPDINPRVVLVGRGPMKAELQSLIVRLGLGNRVVMAGHVPHLEPQFVEYYRNADAFVHFSTSQPSGDKEGIPGTIIEAMASGLPVIATRHAGIPEVITDGVHGILLEENDSVGIAASLIRLHDCNGLRQRLGQTAAARALRELDVRTKTRELERIYESVVRNRKGAR